MGDGSYFDGGPKQADFGYNSSGSVFNDPGEAAYKAMEQVVVVKQFLAGKDLFEKAPEAIGPLFEGEVNFNALFEAIDSALTMAVGMIELGEAIMAGVDAATGDPSGIIGELVGNVSAMGMTFLLEWLQPLQDLFGMLTGNPGRIRTSRDMWVHVGQGIMPVGSDLVGQSQRLDAVWKDEGSDAAKLRLTEGNDLLQVAAAMAFGVAGSLDFCAATFEKVQGFLMNRASDVFGLVAECIVKFLVEGPKALADIAIDIIPMLARITLELIQLGMHMARAFGALMGLLVGAQEAADKMNPYIDKMSAA